MRKREDFQIPSVLKAYKCDDCGCIFEGRILRGKQGKTTTPHLEAWMSDVNNCCHCGGTMLAEWKLLTKKEAAILNALLITRKPGLGAGRRQHEGT